MSLVFILILAMTLMVLMIPKAHSTAGTGVTINIFAPGPAPHRNDAIGPGPQGFLYNPASPPLPGVPPLVSGPAIAPPWPFAGFIGPAGPQPVAPWSNEGGGVYYGAPPPIGDGYIPDYVYDAAGGGPYYLVSVSWSAGIDLGCEGNGPNRILYSWDTDSDGSLERYMRGFGRDAAGVITVTYSSAVGGIIVPTDKFGLLAPYIGLASTILVATVATAVYAKRVKRRKEKQ